MLLSELAKLAPAKKSLALNELVRRSRGPANGQLEGVRAEVHNLEVKHGMTTEEMKQRFCAGDIPDTMEFVEWLQLAKFIP